MTYRKLDEVGVEYEVLDLTAPEQAEKLEEFKAMNLLQAPIVDAGGEPWAGFRPDKIAQLA